MTVTIAALVLRLARTTAAGLDVPSMLADVCRTTQAVLGVRAVVAATGRPADGGLTALAGSDETAERVGRLQRLSRGGPLVAVIRSGRTLHTADLTRIGPPELAAAAADAGLTGSLTVPLLAGGEPVGALQLLGDAGRPVGPEAIEPVAAVLDVLAARLADADDLRRLVGSGSGPCDADTAVIRVGRRAEPTPSDGPGDQNGPPTGPGNRLNGNPGELFRPAPGRPDRGTATERAELPRQSPGGPGRGARRESAGVARGEAAGLAGGSPGELPTERLPAAATPPVPQPTQPVPQSTQPAGPLPSPRPPSPGPRPAGPSEVRVPAPRYHEPSASTFFADDPEPPAAEPDVPQVTNGSAVNGSAVNGSGGRHGKGGADSAQ